MSLRAAVSLPPEASWLSLVIAQRFARKDQVTVFVGLYYITCNNPSGAKGLSLIPLTDISRGDAMSCQTGGQQLSVGSI